MFGKGMFMIHDFSMISSCVSSLCVEQENIVRFDGRRSNLCLSVSRDTHDRVASLIALLRSKRFCNLDSLIIYVTMKMQTEQIASALRVSTKFVQSLISMSQGARRSSPEFPWRAGWKVRKTDVSSEAPGEVREADRELWQLN